MERPDSRLIRVFLSSTFVDFQEERSLLVQQVFPSLRRRARSREVEIVDVDLRWGVTAEQTERGETLPLCLGEIDRCRPYFISLLGERYGWVPPPNHYKPELLERQPWLKERMGRASVTELEILHGVLRDPEMAGHAYFYVRDPAYAQAQSEPGWLADNPAERQRLEVLKAQISASGFPLAEGLPNPQAIAERIEADLWQLIESRFPEQEPADALEREDRRHSDYRRARTGLYLGGEPAIEQLERWVADGKQRILITGDSGAGKSALIANWLETHQQDHPQDLVHAHHLGCTNDASAVRPLLGRLIDTASQLLLAEQQISEPLKVPQDWWELVFKVGEVFALLSPWCQRQGRRWILVLDGLDRLAEEDQQALPWIPTTIPPGIHVVASALDCPARTILQERQYRTHEIGPLGKAEQQQLIERYLSRYTKQLECGLQQQILAHPLTGSPLFLKVLLEELRQCAWFDTLQEQVECYLSAETIDGLYAKVLERLENNGHGEATRKALTALWASRAGLSEEEVLGITGLSELQWAPIDLALEQAFGRNGERLVLDHDYLRLAVENFYLPNEGARNQAHINLVDWLKKRRCFTDRDAEELPWQLQKARLYLDLRGYLSDPVNLAYVSWHRGSREALTFWIVANKSAELDEGCELDMEIEQAVECEIKNRKNNAEDLIWFIDQIALLLDEGGMHRNLLLRLRLMAVELRERTEGIAAITSLASLNDLATTYLDMGHSKTAETLMLRCLEREERLLGNEHPLTLTTINNLGRLYSFDGDLEIAESHHKIAIYASEPKMGSDNPSVLTAKKNLAAVLMAKNDLDKAEEIYLYCLETERQTLGLEDKATLQTMNSLGCLYRAKGAYVKAEKSLKQCLELLERLLGFMHPQTITVAANLATLYVDLGSYELAELCLTRCMRASSRLLGEEHPITLGILMSLGTLYSQKSCHEKAEILYTRCLASSERMLGAEHPLTLAVAANLGLLLIATGDSGRSEKYLQGCHDCYIRRYGDEHPATLTIKANLALLYSEKDDLERADVLLRCCYESFMNISGSEHPETLTVMGNLGCLLGKMREFELAESYLRRCHQGFADLHGPEHPSTLSAIHNLGGLYQAKGDYNKAESYYLHCKRARDRVLGADHRHSIATTYCLSEVQSAQCRYDKSIPLRRQTLTWSRQHVGEYDYTTLYLLFQLSVDLVNMGELDEAESLFRSLLTLQRQVLSPGDIFIGRAVSGLSRTLELAGRLEEALMYTWQAFDHYLVHEGSDSWFTNRERLDLAGLMHKLGRNAEALRQLNDLQECLSARSDLEDPSHQLLEEAFMLHQQIMTGKSEG